MSIPLIDFRGKVTPETDAVLEAISRTTGRDKSEIAREWMHRTATKEMDVAIELHRIMTRQGIGREEQGAAR